MSLMFRKLRSFSRNGRDEPARDVWLEQSLESLDPAGRSPSYWFEARRAILLAAAPELARRRRLGELTVSDVVFSWSRTLVPSAMLAAAAAAFLLMRPTSPEGMSALRLEDMLWEAIDLSASDPRSDLAVEISFASEIY